MAKQDKTFTNSAPPVKGDHENAESTAMGRLEEGMSGGADSAGERAVWLLVKKGGQDSPILTAGEDNAKAVPIFTNRENAILYIQVTNDHSYAATPMAPIALGGWLKRMKDAGVKYLAVNVNRPDRIRTDVQPLLALDEYPDLSGENIHDEIWARSAP